MSSPQGLEGTPGTSITGWVKGAFPPREPLRGAPGRRPGEFWEFWSEFWWGANSHPKTTHRDAKPLSPKGSNSSAPGNARGHGENNLNAQALKGRNSRPASRLVSGFQGLIWGLGRRAWSPGALPQTIESEPFRLTPLPSAFTLIDAVLGVLRVLCV